MAPQSPYPELVSLQERTRELPHLKQNILMTYAILGGLESPVERTAAELAQRIGVPAPHFSRARGELAEDGWLEHTHSEGQVKFFRLGKKATGHRVVVPLRTRPTI
jgi:DNA-binding IclR family transcriptional regulator